MVELILKEIRKLKVHGVSKEEMARAKEHIQGSLLLGLEGSGSWMSHLAKDELYFGRSFKLEEVIKRVNRVTLQQIHDVVEALFAVETLSMMVLGPVEAHDLPFPSTHSSR
jgi:predicted Zn-dependent peptidase